jgi:GT2 family glycosyltransferase
VRGADRRDVTVVVATRNRRDEALRTVGRLLELPDASAIVVVDDASTDATADGMRSLGGGLDVVRLDRRRGAAARNVGVRRATTPFVAFADDDSWWEPGSLSTAARLLREHPSLGLVAGRILVGPERRVDPVCVRMSRSPLRRGDDLPWPAVLGFVACGAVVRRDAFLQAGGFHPRLGIGGEERLLALDLARAGWVLAYVDDVVAVHEPSKVRDREGRRRKLVRNALWTAWLRRRAIPAAIRTGRIVRDSMGDAHARAGLLDAVTGARWVVRERAPLPRSLERDLAAVERHERGCGRRPDLDRPER